MIQIGGRKILQLGNRKLVEEFIGESATAALLTITTEIITDRKSFGE